MSVVEESEPRRTASEQDPRSDPSEAATGWSPCGRVPGVTAALANGT